MLYSETGKQSGAGRAEQGIQSTGEDGKQGEKGKLRVPTKATETLKGMSREVT